MKTKLTILALLGSMLSGPAFAWGDREQGIVSGIAGYWLYQQLSRPPQVVQQPNYSYGNTPGYNPGYAPGYNSYPYSAPSLPPPLVTCRQVLSIQYDRFGNEYRYPVTVCGQ